MRAHASTTMRRLRAWSATTEGRVFLALLAVALVVRLLVAPFHGFFHDVDTYASWGVGMWEHLRTAYSQRTAGYMRSNYPPLMMELLALWIGLYGIVAALFGAHPTFDAYQSAVFAFYMKVPLIAADLTVISVLYAIARRVVRIRWAMLAAASYAFSPAVILDSALWGQTDDLMLLPLLLALYCVWKRKPYAAGALFATAVLLKPHATVVGVLLVVYLWRWEGKRAVARFLGVLAYCGLAITSPFLLPPHPQIFAFIANVQRWARVSQNASNFAFNLWWLISPHANYARPLLGPLSPATIGLLLLAPILLLAAVGIWRDASLWRLALAAGLVELAFFNVTPLEHERYIFPTLALFLVAAFWYQRSVVFYLVTSGIAFFNMLLMIAVVAPPVDMGTQLAAWRALGKAGAIWTLVVAEIDVALLLYVIVTYALSLRERSQPLAAQPAPSAIREASGVGV